MSKHIKTETWVGLFLIGGLGLIIGIIIFFGDFRDSTKKSYPLSIEFTDAGSIIPGSTVRMGGAVIGKVTSAPRLLPSGKKVILDIVVQNDIRIPQGSAFQIGMQNILGDSYIDIVPPKSFSSEFIKPDSIIQGTSEGGLGTLKTNAIEASEEVLVLLRNINKNFDQIDQADRKSVV